MCAKSDECKLAERVESLDARVDVIERRVARIVEEKAKENERKHEE